MKLDMDCVRDVLIELEELPLDCHTPFSFSNSVNLHGIDDVCYTLAKLHEGNYINAEVHRLTSGQYDFYGIYDLTFSGHEFLAKIRDPKQWRAVKKGITAVGNYSLSAISAIAEGVTSVGIGTFIRALTGP